MQEPGSDNAFRSIIFRFKMSVKIKVNPSKGQILETIHLEVYILEEGFARQTHVPLSCGPTSALEQTNSIQLPKPQGDLH